MTWELVELRPSTERPDWWKDEGTLGVLLTKSHLYLNPALVDILKVNDGGMLMLFTDKKNNAFAIRGCREGEIHAGYCVRSDKDCKKAFRVACARRLSGIFPWCKPGTTWKAELADNMVVVRNNL